MLKIEELVKELQDKHRKDVTNQSNKHKKAIKDKDKEILRLKQEVAALKKGESKDKEEKKEEAPLKNL